jgi:hypothetical protein
MNVEHGFRRITLLVSIIIGLAVALLCFVLIGEEVVYERELYNDYKEDSENIVYFWRIWDANGWVAGHKGIVRYLKINPYSALFELRDGKTISLNPQDVFPGLDKLTILSPLDEIEKEAQNAKIIAIQRAKNNIEKYAYWGEKKLFGIVLFGVGIALLVGVIGFSLVWLLFFLIRWLVLGFCVIKPKEEQNNK